MSKHTREDIVRMVREQDVEFIRMQFTDIFGQLKNVAITASQIEKAVGNEIMIDGSSIEGFVRIQESDQYLRPDLDSFAILPWRPQHGRVARLICDVYNPDGTPFVGDPRGVLKRALKKAAAMGYSFNVGPECEFFLFETDAEGRPTTKTGDEAGYFDLGPLDHGEHTRREICMALGADGLRDRGLAPRSRRRAARNRLPLRRRADRRGRHHDVQVRRQVHRAEERPARHVHAQAGVRRQRLRDAHEYVAVPRRQKRVLRRKRPAPPVPRRVQLHRRPAAPRQGAWPPSPIRSSTPTSGSCPATKRPATSRGRRATARR